MVQWFATRIGTIRANQFHQGFFKRSSDLRDSPRACDSQLLMPQNAIRKKRGSVREPWNWGTSKQHMKLQQPRNYDFRVSQFNPARFQGGNDREMTTSPPGHHWQARVALTTTAKLQQLGANSRDMKSCNNRKTQRPWSDKLETAQSLQNVHEILRCFMAVVVSTWSAFWKSLGNGSHESNLRIDSRESTHLTSAPSVTKALPNDLRENSHLVG